MLDPDLSPVAKATTTHPYSETVTETITLDLAQIWEDTVGNFFSESAYWLEGYKFHNVDTTKENPKWSKDAWTPDYSVTLRFEEVDGVTTKTLKAEDFAKAYIALVREGWKHCGGCAIDDPDACVTDTVVQYACFGEAVFG